MSQTVAGEIVDDTPPAAPVILAASIANMNELSANGTAEPGKTITLFQDSLALSPTVTSHASTGAWSIGPITLSFNSNFTLKAQASEPGVGNPNRSAFGEYSPAFNYVQPQVTKPTLTIDGETKSTWSNTAGTFTLRGTTEAGSTIAITANGQAVSPASGPTVVGTDWTATLTVANESQTNFKATATLANHLPNESDPYGLLIDRVAPTITLTGGAQTVGLPNVGSSNDLGFSVADASSGVATQTSNWDTQVSTTTQGTYTVTYNATDVAGNSASPVTRDVTVTTEVIIPVITSVTANSNGTFTIEGTVTGDYADNLTVQVTIDDSNSGSAVAVSSGAFTHTTSAKSPGTYQFKAKSINSAADESSSSSTQTATISVPDTEKPVITLVGAASVSFTEGDSYTDAGATALDNFDGDITDQIVTTIVDATDAAAVLNASTPPGVYTIKYNVSDSASPTPWAADEVSRTVTVEAAASFIEELKGHDPYFTTNSSLTGLQHNLQLNLNTDGIMAYGSDGETVEEEFTISWWMDLDTSQDAGVVSVLGNYALPNRFALKISGAITSNAHITTQIGGATMFNNNSGLSVAGAWVHGAYTCKSNGSNLIVSIFINGTKLGGTKTYSLGTKLLPSTSNDNFGFGSSGMSGKSVKGSFDSIQFGDGVALTDAQVAAIAAQSDRQMSIATASGL